MSRDRNHNRGDVVSRPLRESRIHQCAGDQAWRQIEGGSDLRVRKRRRQSVAAKQIKIARLDASGEACDFEGVAIRADGPGDDVPLRMAVGLARRNPAQVNEFLHQRVISCHERKLPIAKTIGAGVSGPLADEVLAAQNQDDGGRNAHGLAMLFAREPAKNDVRFLERARALAHDSFAGEAGLQSAEFLHERLRGGSAALMAAGAVGNQPQPQVVTGKVTILVNVPNRPCVGDAPGTYRAGIIGCGVLVACCAIHSYAKPHWSERHGNEADNPMRVAFLLEVARVSLEYQYLNRW